MITASTTESAPIAKTVASNDARSETVLDSDFDTFLKMLTTQAMNQDPLNPIDSSEYAAQLAQFSSVEQQVLTNDLLENVVSMLSTSGVGDMAGWIGRNVRSDTPAYFDGMPIDLSVTRNAKADSAVLEVLDDTGALIQSVPLSSRDPRITWTGVDAQGVPFPAGQYHFRVDNRLAGESIGTTAVATFNEVTEARLENGKIQLVLKGGQVVSTDAVTGIKS